mgnify:CR=1 FL=1
MREGSKVRGCLGTRRLSSREPASCKCLLPLDVFSWGTPPSGRSEIRMEENVLINCLQGIGIQVNAPKRAKLLSSLNDNYEIEKGMCRERATALWKINE